MRVKIVVVCDFRSIFFFIYLVIFLNKKDNNHFIKATWNSTTTKLFIKACLNEVLKGKCNWGTFTRKGWSGIMSEFNEKTINKYDKNQFWNKMNSLRMNWSIWIKLKTKETRVRWNDETNTMKASDEWWEKKLVVWICDIWDYILYNFVLVVYY